MSDLQCPARILVARHGEAEYAVPFVLSDAHGRLTETGRQQARDLGERLAGERVAAVYSSYLDRARQTAAIVAERLGLTPSVVDGVEEFRVGSLEGVSYEDARAMECFVAWVVEGDLDRRWPGAQTGRELVDRFSAGLAGVADRHRGETVVVVSHGGVMTLGISHTAANVAATTARQVDVPHCAVAEVEVDADGWRLVGPWPGREWQGPDRTREPGA